jgi:hypothetical protein
MEAPLLYYIADNDVQLKVDGYQIYTSDSVSVTGFFSSAYSRTVNYRGEGVGVCKREWEDSVFAGC